MEETIIEAMAAQIVPAVAVVTATLISAGVAYLIKWLKIKTGSDALVTAGEIVASTVNELAASTVKGLKASSSDGKLTLNEARAVKDTALSRVKQQMPDAIAKASVLAIGDLNAFIDGKIEQEVTKQKISVPK